MEFFRQEFLRGEPFPSPGDLPNPGIEPGSHTLQGDSLPAGPQGKPENQGFFVWAPTPYSGSGSALATPTPSPATYSLSHGKRRKPDGQVQWLVDVMQKLGVKGSLGDDGCQPGCECQ